jgi:hypothetical protein
MVNVLTMESPHEYGEFRNHFGMPHISRRLIRI